MKQFFTDVLGIVAPLALTFLATVGPVYAAILAQKAVALLSIKDEQQRLDVEKRFRDALHESAWNAINYAMGKLGIDAGQLTLGGSNTQLEILRQAIRYVKDKNPDAVKALGVTNDMLADILVAKLQTTAEWGKDRGQVPE